MLDRLAGAGPSGPAEPGILVADELGAAEAATLDPRIVTGIATAGGGPTSHAVDHRPHPRRARGGGPRRGRARDRRRGAAAPRRRRRSARGGPRRRDRRALRRLAPRGRAARGARRASGPTSRRSRATAGTWRWPRTSGAADDAAEAVARGADGVGLLRTEFLFLDRATAPDEEEQLRAYGEIGALMEGRRTVLRTLDAGADKPLAFARLAPEENPFLGVRGVRLSLARPELLVTQLRAVLRAAAVSPAVGDVPDGQRGGRAARGGRPAGAGPRVARRRRPARRAGGAGRDDRGPGGRPPGRHARRRGRLPVDRHQRPGAVHDGRRARQRGRGAPLRPPPPRRAAADRGRGGRRPRRTPAASRCAARRRPTVRPCRCWWAWASTS